MVFEHCVNSFSVKLLEVLNKFGAALAMYQPAWTTEDYKKP